MADKHSAGRLGATRRTFLSASAVTAATPPPSDNYAGTSRRAAKLSLGTGPIEPFADVAALVATLPPDANMIHHVPPLGTGADSGRVTEEQRNVRLTGFLYACSREMDNDFHLMIGRAANAPAEMYMTVEVSGLPPANAPSYASMKSARDAFKAYFGQHLPQLTYDYYDPPIPVVITGSLFFDMDHATGPHPGPPSLKSHIPTIWEVHPVSAITLGTQAGAPAAANVRAVTEAVSPQGEQIHILHTNETDEYDKPT